MHRYHTETIVKAIHASPTMASIFTTGGGTEAFSLLLAPGGGSATLIAGMIPYGMKSSKRIIGGKLDKLVSEAGARALGMAAFQHSLDFNEAPDAALAGIATTSILQRMPDERAGRMHSIYIAAQTSTETFTWTLDIPPDHPIRTGTAAEIREFEEHLNAVMVVNALAHVANVMMIPLNHGLDEKVVFKKAQLGYLYPSLIEGLMTGSSGAVCFGCFYDGRVDVALNHPQPFILPGSFNPVYEGHIGMADAAAPPPGDGGCSPVDFELSISNMDKPRMDLLSLEERLKGFCQFATPERPLRVWVTNAPSFIAKAGLFPNRTFVVGFDTIRRIADPSYGIPLKVVAEIFQATNTSFRVCGRKDGDNFADDLTQIDPLIGQFCTIVEGFRNDGSSTAIRAAKEEAK